MNSVIITSIFKGRANQHKDRDFKELLKEVDGLRFVPHLKDQSNFLVYQCQYCQQRYQRKRKVDTKRYRCGVCRGKLLLNKSA